MNENITLIVADDHPMLLKGLVNELEDYNYNVVAAVDNGMAALEAITRLKPTIAILDIEMPMLSGIEVIHKCKENGLNTKFIILTSHKEKGFIIKSRKLNISGYLIKDEPFIELHHCIQKVNNGGTYFSNLFSDILVNEISPQLQKIKFLSPSERTIVRLIAQENSSKEIGVLLSISYRTVEKHRSNIISKLDLSHDMDALSVWAVDHKDIILNL